MKSARSLLALCLVALAAAGIAADSAVGQTIADLINREAATDVALIVDGLIKQNSDQKDLSKSLSYETDELWQVELTGKQLKEAFEKSVSFFPSPFSSFLQISEAKITFDPSKPIGSRIQSVTLGETNQPLDSEKKYKVAMPASLAKGGFGYNNIWEFKTPSRIVRPTIGEVVRGKGVHSQAFRWLSNPSSSATSR
jgi:2',3'-cyclic-nucleotide 2'-phosphodiesterase (5'-nucleotidase family)